MQLFSISEKRDKKKTLLQFWSVYITIQNFDT